MEDSKTDLEHRLQVVERSIERLSHAIENLTGAVLKHQRVFATLSKPPQPGKDKTSYN
jgi:hypothetical protein